MKIFKLLTATILLSAFSHSAFADEQADAQMITNSTFCAMYSTRLTQTSDSGLQRTGIQPGTSGDEQNLWQNLARIKCP